MRAFPGVGGCTFTTGANALAILISWSVCEESQNEVIETVEVQDAAFKKITRRAQQGMTLIEIMVVIAIIGLIAGVVGVQVFGRLEDAQVETSKTQIKQISDALELYRLSFRNYPSRCFSRSFGS